MKRTLADEMKLDAQLRREEDIKREVIVDLRDENRDLYQSNARLIANLINTSELLKETIDALRMYRERALKLANDAAQRTVHCAAGCRRHVWDSEKGWQRADER